MKKLVIVLFLTFLFLNLTLVSSAEIQLTKENYAPGETLQAEISGNFISGLNPSNIYFYRERNIPVLYDILKTKDKYLLYAILPVKEGNYTLKIKNTKYTIATGTGTSTEDIIKEFKIEASNESILTVNPGFIVAREDFDLKIKSNENQEIEAEFEATGEKQTLNLIQNFEKKIHFSISGITSYTASNLKIGGYNIPVFVFPEKSQEEIIQETGAFRFNPLELKSTILVDQDFSFKISLLNLGDINITNIALSTDLDDSDLEIEISPETISELEAGGEEFIDLLLVSNKEGAYSGKLIALSEFENLTVELALSIEVTENESEIEYESPGYIEEVLCSEVGKVCATGEVCDGQTKFTKDENKCCVGDCETKKQPLEITWFWGIIIIVIVLLALGFLYFLMKKRQKKTEDFLKRRQKKFEERMNPQEKSEEVRKSLTRT